MFRFSDLTGKIVLGEYLLWLAFCQRLSSEGVLPIRSKYLGIEIIFFHGGKPLRVITSSDILELFIVNFLVHRLQNSLHFVIPVRQELNDLLRGNAVKILEVISVLGGNKKLSESLGITPAAVTHWVRRNKFPAARVLQISQLAVAANISGFDPLKFLSDQHITELPKSSDTSLDVNGR